MSASFPVKIEPVPQYLGEHEDQYAFAYTIHITNQGDEIITLRQGDSYSFPASVVHNVRNQTDRPARLIWAASPVVIPKDVVANSADGEDKTHFV